jgi:hypothetical protein
MVISFLCALRVEAEARYSGAGDRRWRRRPWRPLGLGQNEGALQNGLGVRPSSGRSEATRGRDKRERFGLPIILGNTDRSPSPQSTSPAGNGEIAPERKNAATSTTSLEQTPANTLSKLPENTPSTQPSEGHPNN